MKMDNLRIGEILVFAGYITQSQLEEALAYKERYGVLLGEAVIQKGYMTKEDWQKFIKTNIGVRMGDQLVENDIITVYQLKHALGYQKQYGGRLGDILVRLGYASTEQLEQMMHNNERRKPKLGEVLFNKGFITKEQLEHALQVQQRSGGRIGDILIFLKYVTEDVICREVASQNNIGRIGNYFEPITAKKLPYEVCLKYNVNVLYVDEAHYCLAVKEILDTRALIEIGKYLDKPIEQVLATNEEMNRFWKKIYGSEQLRQSLYKLYDTDPDNSAYDTFNRNQRLMMAIIGILIMSCLLLNYRITLFVLIIVSQIIYMIVTALKLYIVKKGANEDAQMRFNEEEISSIKEEALPIYTLLIPVYKEAGVITTLMQHVERLDYPQHKLDVCILLEEDDIETIEVVQKLDLPSNYRPMIVPTCQPKTKPKACNYGLIRSLGEYVVIYDAEDRPEPDQLKKAYLAFQKLPKEYACIQSKLNYYNSQQNILTKWFTQEYSMWFELLLVGIMQLDVPIPLGGTSNHFKIDVLREVGAWDPFNVTEDADLGVRLFKKGYKTAVIDSRTWEEANSKVGNWLRQRSRWIKGYMQTWLVHMRHPVELYRSLGGKGFIGYQTMVLGTPLLPILNPIFWGLLILWILTKAAWIQALFPGIIYYIATIQLIFGNFMFMYTNAMGTYWVIRDCESKHARPFSYGIIRCAILTPIYWIMMSIAAYKALVQLVVKPFYWEKTHHGLTTTAKEENKADSTIN